MEISTKSLKVELPPIYSWRREAPFVFLSNRVLRRAIENISEIERTK